MIVNYTNCGWEIITQRAHGMLVAQIAAPWEHGIRTERWIETLLAVVEHDDAQVEPDGNNLLTPQGGPVDFKMKPLNSTTVRGRWILHYRKAVTLHFFARCI